MRLACLSQFHGICLSDIDFTSLWIYVFFLFFVFALTGFDSL